MNSKLLHNFSYDPIEDLDRKVVFEFLPRLFRKWTAIDINQEIFGIENIFFFHFCSNNSKTITSKFNDNFSEDFFEVLHISVGQIMKILETRPDFLTFSAKTQNRF